MCDVDGTDPFTDEFQLCDDDGMVRRGALHRGTDYPCTSHAHYAGMHIRCTGPAHRRGDPVGLAVVTTLPATMLPAAAWTPAGVTMAWPSAPTYG